jgi:hypothetical protein
MADLVWTRRAPREGERREHIPLTARGLGGEYEVFLRVAAFAYFRDDLFRVEHLKDHDTPKDALAACEAHHAARLAAVALPERAKPSRLDRLRAWLRALFPRRGCCLSCRRPCDDLEADPAGGPGGYCKECA